MKHVTFHLPSFLRRVRIHGGEFDSSARAMNRVNEKGSLMTYEGAFLAQADLRIVRGSTIERKQMSTKTTFKRVALVAVSALGLSLVVVAPSNAQVLQAGFRTLGFESPAATATVGTAVSAVLKQAGSCVEHNTNGNTASAYATLQIDVAPAGTNLVMNSVNASETVTALTGYTNTNATRQAFGPDGWNAYRHVAAIDCVANTSAMSGYNKVTFTPDVPGTYVIVAVVLGGTTAATWTVVASAKTLGWNSAFINTTAGSQSVSDATVSVTAAASTTMKARIDVAQGYGTTSGTDTATAAATKEVVVATTKGLVSKTNDYTATAKSVTTAAGTEAVGDYYVFSNGDVGAASVTVTVGGVLVSTKTVTFQGVAATLSAALTAGQKTWVAPTGTATLTVAAKDSAGATASNTPTITATSATTSVATVVATSNTLVTITGVAAGTSVITIADSAGTATSTTYTVTVAPAKSAVAPVITFGSTSYTVGELVTMTISSGMADSATANLFTTALVYSAGNIVWSGTAGTGATHAISSGKVTYSFYAPAVQGNLTITGTTGADVDLATAAVVTGTVAIANPGLDAATDAANEAIDAANAATDAALAAAEAADAATTAAQEASDAVAALSESVTKLIAGLQAQIKSLAAVVAKIAKKVKA